MSLRFWMLMPLLVLGLALAAGNLGGCPPFTPPDCPPCDDDGDDTDNGDDTDDGDDTTPKTVHERILTEILPDGYEGPQTCLNCHANHALDLRDSAHWNWEGDVGDIVTPDGDPVTGRHGKKDLLNNFCIGVPTNEGRCSQCHPSYGWKDNTFDFTSLENMDCLVCHDTTGTYKKHPSANGGGGAPALMIDGTLTVVTAAELQEVAYNVGTPSRVNCGACHFYAGGGDNVKTGTLASTLVNATFADDVHMGSVATGGQNFNCQTCHTEANHGFAGMVWHSVDEGGAAPNCTRCHGDRPHSLGDRTIATVLNFHTEQIACETCHIPTFSRAMATSVEWYWDEAGEDRTDIPQQEGRPTYDKLKGRFVWQKNVQPAYRWYTGQWSRMIIGLSDTYAEGQGTVENPVVLAAPTADATTEGAKIHPFKKMIGRQVADTGNRRVVVPHLFGTTTGPNPYWGTYDWDLALQDSAAYTGIPYSGTFGFVNTVMYLRVNHEVAPATMALQCDDCHGNAAFWEQIGLADPFGS